ncbi:hypothetical protein M433DRAFT_4793 [Acidomyces richmondensis BFW]|nr:hypothetical protein M433DRAFT_4793 [Acidomyces richmondensis BFW]
MDYQELHVELEGINYFTLLELPDDGRADAPVVLLVHALMSNLHMWDSTVRALHEAGYRTLRYDHVGHHNTPPTHKPETNFHMDDLTRHAHQIVKARTGMTRVHAVIGCSIGGVLALRFAMMFPGDVEKIVSIAAPGITSLEAAKPLWTARIKQFEEDHRNGTDTLCHATVNRWFPGNHPEDEHVKSEALNHVKHCSFQGYKTLADTIRNYDYAEELSSIQDVQCLIVAGSEDGAVDSSLLEQISGKILQAEFVNMQGAGHLPPMHKPKQFNELMLRFLKNGPA